MSPWTALGWLLVATVAIPLSTVVGALVLAVIAGAREAFRR